MLAMYEAMEAEVEQEGERIRTFLISIMVNPYLQPDIFAKLAGAKIIVKDIREAEIYFKPSEDIPYDQRGTIITDDRDRAIVGFMMSLLPYDGRTDLHVPNNHKVRRR